MNPENTPVIVAAGQVCDRDNALDSLDLMEAALRRADAGQGWIATADSLATVAQISFPALGHTAQGLAAQLGIAPKLRTQTPWPTGESPLQLLHDAACRIGSGEIAVALVAGGEALRTAALRKPADPMRTEATKTTPKGLARYGLVAPTHLYPLYENATRAAWGQTLAEAQAETGAIWSAMSRVAAANPDAWLRRAYDAAEIVTPSQANRPIAFPYTKLQVANSSVNMGAAFIVTSLARARTAGATPVFIGASAAGHEPFRVTEWARYDRAPSMIAALRAALDRNAVTADDLDHVELYSCFPCIPKMARRAINLPLERPVTVFGGLTFGGGPVGNYMSHAVAAMVARLRGTAARGLLYANGGYATHHHALVLSGEPTGVSFPHDAAVTVEREPVPPLVETYDGVARIETFTAFYTRDGVARAGTVIARTEGGARVVAAVTDRAEAEWLVSGGEEAVGATGVCATDANGLVTWRRGAA